MWFLLPALLNPLALTAIGGYYFLNVPEKSRPNGSRSKKRFGPGSAQVIREKIKLVDESRTTQAHARFRGRPHRVLKGELIRPATVREPGPLLIYNHGFMSSYRDGEYLMRHFSSHGYTVVAVDYPLTNARAPGRPFARDLINQPVDISFIIDELLKRNEDSEDDLYATIDAGRIALAGVSLGGLTSLLSAYHRGVQDHRIAAVVCIASPTSFLSADFFAGTDVPTLMVYGDKDSLVLYDDHATPGLEKIPNAVLVTLKNASHTGFAQQASTYLRYLRNPDSIACRMIPRAMDEGEWSDLEHLTVPQGANVGIVDPGNMTAPTSPLVTVSMKAARQQMYTAMASHAFLESHFAREAETRDASREFLLRVLPSENKNELSVTR